MRFSDSTFGDLCCIVSRWITYRLIPAVAVFLFSAFAIQANIFAQPEEWRWLRFSTDNGLPSTEINSLCETPAGTAWAGTKAGPAWYNGFFWQHADSTLGLPAAPASALFPLGHDSVVVLTGGLPYIGNSRGFHHLLTPAYSMLLPVLAAVPCGSDSVFFISSDNGRPGKLYLYYRNTVTLVPLPAPLKIAFMAPERENYGLFHTRNNRIWLNTEKGLYRLDRSGWQLMYKHQSFSPISTVVEDSSGNGFFFLALGAHPGFWKFGNDGTQHYTGVGSNFALLSADIAPNGEIIAVYSNGVISYFHKGSWQLVTSDQMETIGATLVYYRPNGDLWLQNRSTLSLYRSSLQRWQYYNYGYDRSRSHINEVLRARDGALWVATGNGLQVHRPGRAVQSFTSINGQKLGGITALAEDRDGGIWIGSGGTFAGAYRWNGSSWRHISKAEGLDAPRIHKIRRDRSGRLWFLTLYAPPATGGNGAFVYENGHFQQWGVPQGLPNGRVYSFAEDKSGSLWFGTLAGISRYRNGEWKHWTFTPEWVDKLFAIAVDSSNKVWFSRFQKGFGYIENDSLHMVPIPSNHSNFNSHNLIVVDLQVDSRNRLWIATQGNGLYCYNNGHFSNINLTMGLGSMNLWPILPAGDRLYIGTIGRGVNILSLSEQDNPPPVVMFSKTAVEGHTAAVSWKPYSYWGQVSPEELQTRYQLDNGSWSEWSFNHTPLFYDLSAGTHTVTVEVKDMFAAVNKQRFTTSFRLPTPFYIDPWFIIPISLLLAITLALAGDVVIRRRHYTAELQSINAQLENRIRERTAALVTTNTHLRSEIKHRLQIEDELRLALSKEKELSELKTRFVGMVSHEFRTPLSAILASADVLDRYYNRLTDDEKIKYYSRIRNSVARITTLMEDVLFIGNANSGKIAIFPMKVDLNAYCCSLLSSMPPEQTERISYSFEGTAEAVLDSKLLRLMLLNILSNAMTYSPASLPVELHVHNAHGEVTFLIIDKGIGIPPEDIDHIFEAFHRGTNIGTVPGSGLGLSIAKECIDLHRGTIAVQSSEHGTEIKVTLPATTGERS